MKHTSNSTSYIQPKNMVDHYHVYAGYLSYTYPGAELPARSTSHLNNMLSLDQTNPSIVKTTSIQPKELQNHFRTSLINPLLWSSFKP